MTKKISWLKYFIPLAGLGLAYYLWQQIDSAELFKSVATPHWKWLMIGFICYSVTTYLRAKRWHMLVYPKQSEVMMMSLTSFHTLLNNVLPARLGELTYIYYLKKLGQVSVLTGTATLLIARFYDLLALILCFSLGLLWVWTQIQVSLIKFLIAFVIMVPLFLGILIHFFSSTGYARFALGVRRVFNLRSASLDKILDLGQKLVDEMSKIAHGSKRPVLFLFSIGIWLVKNFAFLCILWGVGFNIFTWNNMLFGSAFSELTTVLPIHGLAGFGTVEGGWTLGFLLLGLPKELVISSGFAFHIILLQFSFVIGMFGFIWIYTIGLRKKKSWPSTHKVEPITV